MGYGPKQVFTCSIASAASTAYLDMGDKTFRQMSVYFPTMTTNSIVTVYGASTSTATYYPIMTRINSATAQYQTMTINTAVSGHWSTLDCPPFRYLALSLNAAVTVADGATFTILAND